MNGSNMFRVPRALGARLALLAVEESGMSTVEYSVSSLYNIGVRCSICEHSSPSDCPGSPTRPPVHNAS